jgi:MFS family permease
MAQPQGNNEKNYRWNFTFNLLDGASFWFGNSFISATTIFPLFISKCTTSLIPIGLISVITSAGWFIPQLFSARIIERSTKMKKFCVGWGIFLERLPLWVLILSAVAAERNPQLGVILLLVSFTWHAMGAGFIAPSWMGLVAKIFSPKKRGSFMGLTMFIGSGAGVLGSTLSAWMLERYNFPVSFIWLFGIAAVFVTLSWGFLALTREPEGEIETHDRDLKTYWIDLLQILKRDQNFRRYIISSSIIAVGGMGYGFFTVSALQRFQVPDATVGIYTLVMMVGQTVGYLVLGRMADRKGHKLSLEIGVLALALAFSLALFIPSQPVYFVIFALIGIFTSAGFISSMMLVWEFCDISRVPTYSGLANTARGLIGLITPMVAAQIAGRSYGLLFGLCAAFTILGLVLLHFWVREPRWYGKPSESPSNKTLEEK